MFYKDAENIDEIIGYNEDKLIESINQLNKTS